MLGSSLRDCGETFLAEDEMLVCTAAGRCSLARAVKKTKVPFVGEWRAPPVVGQTNPAVAGATGPTADGSTA